MLGPCNAERRTSEARLGRARHCLLRALSAHDLRYAHARQLVACATVATISQQNNPTIRAAPSRDRVHAVQSYDEAQACCGARHHASLPHPCSGNGTNAMFDHSARPRNSALQVHLHAQSKLLVRRKGKDGNMHQQGTGTVRTSPPPVPTYLHMNPPAEAMRLEFNGLPVLGRDRRPRPRYSVVSAAASSDAAGSR